MTAEEKIEQVKDLTLQMRLMDQLKKEFSDERRVIIRSLNKRNRWSQSRISRALGISQVRVGQILQGK